jgi:DNA-directed RNA polymerase III subunit RPC2
MYIWFLKIHIFLGSLVAATDKPAALVRAIRHLRRKGHGSPFVSVYLENRHRCVYIATDGGRLCRLYIIVENGKPKVNAQHIQDLSNGKIAFQVVFLFILCLTIFSNQ